MAKELYFDISSETSGGSLYKITSATGQISFEYDHSTYNDEADEMEVFKTSFHSFADFWKDLTQNPEWFYLHPLFVHPEQRSFVQQQLQSVNWDIHPDPRWQNSHRRQWDKVLSDPGSYYKPGL